MNNDLNDYFLAWFFMSTCIIGISHLTISGYHVRSPINRIPRLDAVFEMRSDVDREFLTNKE